METHGDLLVLDGVEFLWRGPYAGDGGKTSSRNAAERSARSAWQDYQAFGGWDELLARLDRAGYFEK